MLALDDQALARLAIAAGKVPPARRGRWLRDLAKKFEPPPSTQVRRASRRAYYRRRRDGLTALRIDADLDRLREALRLSPEASLQKVQKVLSDLVAQYIDQTISEMWDCD